MLRYSYMCAILQKEKQEKGTHLSEINVCIYRYIRMVICFTKKDTSRYTTEPDSHCSSHPQSAIAPGSPQTTPSSLHSDHHHYYHLQTLLLLLVSISYHQHLHSILMRIRGIMVMCCCYYCCSVKITKESNPSLSAYSPLEKSLRSLLLQTTVVVIVIILLLL